MELHEKACTPCRGGVPPLSGEEAEALRSKVPDWELTESATRLVRQFRFKTYAQALAFVNAISALAEAGGHHPDICFGWGYATVTLWTHKIMGLHENDFIMAAKFDRVFEKPAAG